MLKYYKELVFFVQKLVGDKELAMDITQETYSKTLEKSSCIKYPSVSSGPFWGSERGICGRKRKPTLYGSRASTPT